MNCAIAVRMDHEKRHNGRPLEGSGHQTLTDATAAFTAPDGSMVMHTAPAELPCDTRSTTLRRLPLASGSSNEQLVFRNEPFGVDAHELPALQLPDLQAIPTIVS